jgi:hypothetical protein
MRRGRITGFEGEGQLDPEEFVLQALDPRGLGPDFDGGGDP